LPLAVAGALRQTTGLLQPAVAGGVAATFVGLALGTWLALASQRRVPEAQASDPYDYSSLVDDGASGLAASYLDASASDNTENSGDDPGAPTASGDSSGGAR